MNKALYLKIALALVLSFGVVRIASEQVFVADTPTLQPNIAQNFTTKMKSLAHKKPNTTLAPGQQTKSINEVLANVQPQELAKGVHAREEKNVTQITINDNEVVYIEHTFTVNGKEIKIRVPQGEEPPPIELLEKIYE